ncbi:hypothetical protein RIF29_06899 [Crotalaria pallida]|uniref:Oleosin n=1 Tax=Crotalaria pallida TaxID=3830 RepID=A0AAN9J3L3_CROPI
MAETQQHNYYHDHQGKDTNSTSQILAIATLVPFGASLLILAGFTLTATVLGLAIATPLFIFFSPVLVPAALVIGLAVTGFLTSGAFGVTSLSSFAWMANYLRRSRLPERLPGQLQYARDLAQETLGNLAQRTKEAAETGINKAQSMASEAVKGPEENQTSSSSSS